MESPVEKKLRQQSILNEESSGNKSTDENGNDSLQNLMTKNDTREQLVALENIPVKVKKTKKKRFTLTMPKKCRPDYKKYSSYSSRLKTFKDWPATDHAKPKDLAKAGFFYEGPTHDGKLYFLKIIVLITGF